MDNFPTEDFQEPEDLIEPVLNDADQTPEILQQQMSRRQFLRLSTSCAATGMLLAQASTAAAAPETPTSPELNNKLLLPVVSSPQPLEAVNPLEHERIRLLGRLRTNMGLTALSDVELLPELDNLDNIFGEGTNLGILQQIGLHLEIIEDFFRDASAEINGNHPRNPTLRELRLIRISAGTELNQVATVVFPSGEVTRTLSFNLIFPDLTDRIATLAHEVFHLVENSRRTADNNVFVTYMEISAYVHARLALNHILSGATNIDKERQTNLLEHPVMDADRPNIANDWYVYYLAYARKKPFESHNGIDVSIIHSAARYAARGIVREVGANTHGANFYRYMAGYEDSSNTVANKMRALVANQRIPSLEPGEFPEKQTGIIQVTMRTTPIVITDMLHIGTLKTSESGEITGSSLCENAEVADKMDFMIKWVSPQGEIKYVKFQPFGVSHAGGDPEYGGAYVYLPRSVSFEHNGETVEALIRDCEIQIFSSLGEVGGTRRYAMYSVRSTSTNATSNNLNAETKTQIAGMSLNSMLSMSGINIDEAEFNRLENSFSSENANTFNAVAQSVLTRKEFEEKYKDYI